MFVLLNNVVVGDGCLSWMLKILVLVLRRLRRISLDVLSLFIKFFDSVFLLNYVLFVVMLLMFKVGLFLVIKFLKSIKMFLMFFFDFFKFFSVIFFVGVKVCLNLLAVIV